MNYGFLIDNSACIGCHACSTACKSENEVPLGVYRTWVKSVEVGLFPNVSRSFQVTRCNHCSDPPCVKICPTAAMFQRKDGIVDFASDACIGCKACIQACPYDAIHIDPSSHTAAKCNFCAHRTEIGLEPACVVVCPEHAILAGDLDDPASEISRVIARSRVTVRKPEQGTHPKLFYIEGQVRSLDPLTSPAASAYTSATSGAHASPAGLDLPSVRSAAVRISYDVHHESHWGWPIATYLVTKHVAGGGAALLAIEALRGGLDGRALMTGLLASLAAVGVTLGLLVYDLDRPDRFLYLLARPQWRSWVARAAWILTLFTLTASLWCAFEGLSLQGILPATLSPLRLPLALIVGPLGLLSAIYTAFLFAQAEGRDLWQAPHQPLLMTFQAASLGAALCALCGSQGWPAPVIGASALLGGILALSADLGPQQTAVARAGAREMTAGRYRTWWRAGILLAYGLPTLLASLGLPELAGLCAAAGLFCYGYAWVSAPQAVRNS